MTTAETRRRVLENRLRRIADRTGYRLTKAGPDAFLLSDAKTNVAVLGVDGGQVFTASLSGVKAFLEKEDRKRKK
jgi:hypothetical protein